MVSGPSLFGPLYYLPESLIRKIITDNSHPANWVAESIQVAKGSNILIFNVNNNSISLLQFAYYFNRRTCKSALSRFVS